MDRRMHIIAGALFLVLYLTGAGCAAGGAARLPMPGALAGSPADEATMREGRALFVTSCAECHRHYWPAEYDQKRWRTILLRHRSRVHTTAERFGALERYVITASEYAARGAREN